MKAKKERRRSAAMATAAAVPQGRPWWIYPLAAAGVLLLAFIAYSPALHGPFLFDDSYLPFAVPGQDPALRWWIGVVRPLLMVTYWVNFRLSGADTYWYHAVNVILHAVTSLIVFGIVRRLLERAGTTDGRCNLVAAIAAAIFLVHPVQTESVAYIAGRSECLSVLFVMGAFAVAVEAGAQAISWRRTMAVLLLFLAALTSKEHAVVLVPLLLLHDYFWNPGFSLAGIRRNWRLYSPLVVGMGAGVLLFWSLITRSTSAGFALKDFTWYQYLFTQFRALFVYLGLFVLPFSLNLDYDFPISMSIVDHGAILGLAGLLAISAVAWKYRHRYRLASFGWFAFLLLMAPTSSILPIRDPIAERRMYLGMLGLLLIVVEALRHLKADRRALGWTLAAILGTGTALTWSRAAVYASPVAQWLDTVAKSPRKVRPHFQLASAYYAEGRCDLAAKEFAATASLAPPNYDLLVDWALALDCLNEPIQAVAKLRQAAAMERTAHVYSQIGMVYAKHALWPEAMEALNTAEQVNSYYPMTYVYKGGVHLSNNEVPEAIKEYRHALWLDPKNQPAKEGLAMAEQRLAQPR
jgi:protein O-mannosyl-transferase